MSLQRRKLAPLAAWMLGAPLLPLSARAGTAVPDAWPSQPLTVVVPFAPGGSVDVAARLVMPQLAERLGQPVVIENTVGASGTIATQRVIKARPDGHTLLFGVASCVLIAPLVYPERFRYDGLRELLPVAPIAASAFVLAGRPDLPATTAAELVRLSRQQAGRLTIGTDGVGTSLHLTAEMLQQQAGLAWTHVPYKSGPQVLTELAGSQIDLALLPVALVQSFVREGKVRGLGVTSRQRAATLPGTPSLSETPPWQSFEVLAWQGLLLPARTDARIAARLAREVADALTDPALVRKLAEAGFQPMTMEQNRFIAHLEREKQLLEQAVRAAHMRSDS
ncbi:Bug family tripartite tricarboxylate transporter substrate binding protein [Delftia sp. PS-11]|uniref:Bug family tripartite tricarboxylate transporter substrate binding protein n=1 Tax=Delftia sp. PS-11 TaxID=2767222 RepID=UPI0024578C3E|nr:tripartite tricarboxylate transporter substrate binding protein [Delftia sp. PS-11]KAJ8746175.1 tripartite tricarboxylate transporter substrate binding protein [Delftia sp. PS-11]